MTHLKWWHISLIHALWDVLLPFFVFPYGFVFLLLREPKYRCLCSVLLVLKHLWGRANLLLCERASLGESKIAFHAIVSMFFLSREKHDFITQTSLQIWPTLLSVHHITLPICMQFSTLNFRWSFLSRAALGSSSPLVQFSDQCLLSATAFKCC